MSTWGCQGHLENSTKYNKTISIKKKYIYIYITLKRYDSKEEKKKTLVPLK